MDLVLAIALIVAALLIGAAVSGFIFFRMGIEHRKRDAEAQIESAEKEAQRIVSEAREKAATEKKTKLVEAKDEIYRMRGQAEKEIQKLKTETEKELKERRSELTRSERRLQQKEENLDKKNDNIEKKEEQLQKKLKQADEKLEEADKIKKSQMEILERISQFTMEQAKEHLLSSLETELVHEKAVKIQSFENQLKDECESKARQYISLAISRCASDQVSETAVSVVTLPNDEMKGRIIGREGRNIRALEAATGVEIVVDDTPEAIVLSAFDPVRREIARLALHQLVTDGRIHPARIEEVVAKVKKQVEEEIIETGKRTTIDLGIHGLHPELIRIIGKMKYRSSYGQNLLQHARETANLCAVMASELGLNPKKAKRAGLLHDIGKVPDEEPELPHALFGMKIAEKYKEKADICNAIGAHHDEVEMTSLLAPIVQVCDAISGARPGARREIVEAYIKRLNDLEQLAMSYPGVTKTYAIQAGRELRVIVGADKIDDKQTESLSTEIAKKIQDEMTYPGQVKITVIRETRAVSFAK